MFASLVWVAWLCAGFGGTAAVLSQTLASKLAPHVPHLQRHAGTSLANRAALRGLAHAASSQRFSDDLGSVVVERSGDAVPESTLRLEAGELRAHLPPTSAGEAPGKPDNRAHPSRAPPASA